MAEFMFTLKCLVATVILLFVMQIKVANQTIETHAQRWIETSGVANYLQKVSAGAVLTIRNVSKSTNEFVDKTMKNEDVQRAARFNFEVKRSPQGTSQGGQFSKRKDQSSSSNNNNNN